jgi:hypothetical protein
VGRILLAEFSAVFHLSAWRKLCLLASLCLCQQRPLNQRQRERKTDRKTERETKRDRKRQRDRGRKGGREGGRE